MQILDGKQVSKARREALKAKVQDFTREFRRSPHLVVVLVGNHGPSEVYVRNKEKACADVGLKSTKLELSAEVSQSELLSTVQKLNNDPQVDGILVQLPLPGHIDEKAVLRTVSPQKDADVFSFERLGELWAEVSELAPCTPTGVISILDHYGIAIEGLRAAVVGRSNIVGKPMAHLLTMRNATVTLCHSKTKNLREILHQCDLIVVAAGRREFLGKDDFKQGAIVIDVGIHGSGSGGKITGDVRFEELQGWAKAATPVPGGVGPMTITTLLENTVTLAQRRLSEKQ